MFEKLIPSCFVTTQERTKPLWTPISEAETGAWVVIVCQMLCGAFRLTPPVMFIAGIVPRGLLGWKLSLPGEMWGAEVTSGGRALLEEGVCWALGSKVSWTHLLFLPVTHNLELLLPCVPTAMMEPSNHEPKSSSPLPVYYQVFCPRDEKSD